MIWLSGHVRCTACGRTHLGRWPFEVMRLDLFFQCAWCGASASVLTGSQVQVPATEWEWDEAWRQVRNTLHRRTMH